MLTQVKTFQKQAEDWLLSPEAPSTNIFHVFVWRIARIAYALVRDIIEGSLTLRAMSLVYTTILSIVPLLALSFSLLKVFNFHDRFAPMLYQFFEPMGQKGLEIYHNVLQFVENMKVGVLGVLGLVMLLYTVMSLIQKVEEAFNSIWHAPGSRSLVRRFSNYLSAVFLGPILAVLAMSLTASTLSSSLVQEVMAIEPFGALFVSLQRFAPFAVIIFGFFLFYLFMPNAKVSPKSAFVGALVGGATWQLMSLAFGHFIVGSARYDAVYSGFAVGILLLIWLYINWLVLLLGSSIAFYHQHDNYITKYRGDEASPLLQDGLAIKIMQQVGRAYDQKEAPVLSADVERMHGVPGVMVRKVLHVLIENELLVPAGDKSEYLVPARSTDRILLGEILSAIHQDRHDLMSHLGLDSKAQALVSDLDTMISANFEDKKLRDLL